jgi:hypothetical protein
MKHALPIVLLLPVLAMPGSASAHCDGMDGPVVVAAQRALESGNVDLVLVWVRAADEPDIRQAFAQTQAVRTLSPQARALADRYFFETLVRVHRAGEGAPYTGLKPAGRDLGPAIPAADKALQSGDVEPLVALLTHAVAHGVRERFAAANAARRYDVHDVAAGRSYVEAYVPFIHYVERLYQAATVSPHGHFHEEP